MSNYFLYVTLYMALIISSFMITKCTFSYNELMSPLSYFSFLRQLAGSANKYQKYPATFLKKTLLQMRSFLWTDFRFHRKENIKLIFFSIIYLLIGLVVKNPPTNAGDLRDTGSIPRLRRHPVEGHGNPLQYSCLENPMDRGAWWATVHGVAKSQTRLKRLSTQPLIIFPTKNRLNKSQKQLTCTYKVSDTPGVPLKLPWHLAFLSMQTQIPTAVTSLPQTFLQPQV